MAGAIKGYRSLIIPTSGWRQSFDDDIAPLNEMAPVTECAAMTEAWRDARVKGVSLVRGLPN
jgi:hypothetical protein